MLYYHQAITLNPMDYTLYMGNTNMNENDQVIVLGKEQKMQEKIILS